MSELIPAADFDFSTIRAKDEVLMKFSVAKVNGNVITLAHRDDEWIFFTRDVHSVIPAPKPKTLRDRIIEAIVEASPAMGGINLGRIVDAVMTELEEGT